MEHQRRTPRQERSKATRDAILEAAARVFSDVGLARGTTKRIAEVAGVSPGSMYEYFPSKESLIAALYEREADVVSRAVLDLIVRIGLDDVPHLVEGLIEWMLDNIVAKPGLNRVLFEEVPRLSGISAFREIEVVMAERIRATILADASRTKAHNLEVAAQLVVATFRHSLIGATFAGPPKGEARKVFVRELTDLLCCYILCPRPWRTG